MALAGVMSALDCDISMTDNRFENLLLVAPDKLSKAIAGPTDGIQHVCVLGWVEQVCKNGPIRLTSISLTVWLANRRTSRG